MPFQYLEQNGYEVTRLKVDQYGNISLDELRDAIREDTALVSLMHVNNEIGTVEPIEEAAEIIHEKNPNTVFHVDAIQSYGKIPVFPKRTGIDLLSVSGHKIHGPKGSGFLYIKDKVRVRPLVFGGGQERLMRSGTENVPAIAGLGTAVSEIFEDLPGHLDEFVRLRKIFSDGIKDIDGLSINGPLVPYDGAMAKSYDGKKNFVQMLHRIMKQALSLHTSSACPFRMSVQKCSYTHLKKKESLFLPAPPAHQTAPTYPARSQQFIYPRTCLSPLYVSR